MKELLKPYMGVIKIVGGIIAVLLVCYILYRVYIYIKESARPTDSGDVSETGGDVLEVDQTQLTWPEDNYIIFADQLEAAMTHMGVDGDEVIRIWETMQSGDDILQTIKAFAKRSNYLFGVPKYTAGLIKWMGDELSSSDLAKVREIFQAKGIAF